MDNRLDKMASVEELESMLQEVLPKNSTSEADPSIPELTRRLIEAGEGVRTASYTHSVCHLFEHYGYKEGRNASYLNSLLLLPVAEELVDFTLRKAWEGGEFGCVDRIIYPIIEFNLAHMEETPKGYMFRPEIITNPEFFQALYSVREQEYFSSMLVDSLTDFCQSDSVSEFFPKFTEALRKRKGLEKITDTTEIIPGVFIDVDQTFIVPSHRNEEDELIYKKLPLTHEYALRKLDEGVPVTIFTGGNTEWAAENLRSAGVDERLQDVKPKRDYIGKALDVCVDDTAPTVQGIRAKTHYSSGKEAWDAEYS